ncbi:DNA topoisomerase 3 [Echinicola marina]|uniref:type IA DNA topoisomerase n=1 Tax=Echinicola marina TaxID=2859768 RepID=UPI001CF69DC6|nr:type IA DNA topoisomerase [Echinicola marina]UCS92020.1 DNA topoisomerase 3 [Echinicola marina]
MKVCIAEKPSVAKEIAQVIGANARKDGYFEGNGYQVTWTFGHFCTLYPPEDYDSSWKRWDLYTLPMLPKRFETKVIEDSGVKKQFKVIQQLFKKAEVVINCGDAGQEGELIQRWVMKQADYKGPVQRLWISSLTTESIQSGFDNLKPAEDFDNLFYAGSSRAIGDWLLGMNATRLYTLKYGGYKQLLSIGRVQTPTLAMLVQRHHEIENFQPEPYWELQTLYRETKFSSTEGKFFKKEDGEKLLEQVSGKDLFITDIEKKEGKEYAPKLFDLTSLQVYCNNKFGFTADTTLKLVQKLYEMKVVTYPRVDTTFLPNDMYPKVPGILKGLGNYSQYTSRLLGKKIRKSPKVFNDKKVTDHHAIIPTGEQKPLPNAEQKIYDIIVRRFIAVFYPDCKVAKTSVSAAVETVTFQAKGKEILEEGWRVLFPKESKKNKEDDDKEDEEGILPSFDKGEHGPHEPSFTEKTTKPPKHYTEASLLRAMETAGKQVEDEELRDLMKANGIGRPSTRASIIETLFRRKYIERRKKQVVPTEMGIQLIGTIQNELLKSAELTGQWEKQLKEIEEGEFSAIKFIHNMKKMVAELVQEVRLETGKPRLAAPEAAPSSPKSATKETATKSNATTKSKKSAKSIEEVICPKCKQGHIIKGKSAYGCSHWKSGCNLRLPFKFLEKKLTDKQVQRLLEKKSTTKLKGFMHNGQKVDGIIQLRDDFQLEFESKDSKPKEADTNKMPSCPKCKKGSIIKGKTAYGCSDWKSGCDFRFAFQDIKTKANGRPLTKELVLEIISS